MSTIRPLPTLRKPILLTPHPLSVDPVKLSYSVKEAAMALGISDKTVWGFINRGDLPTFRLPGLDRVLIKACDLASFVNGQPSIYRNHSAEERTLP